MSTCQRSQLVTHRHLWDLPPDQNEKDGEDDGHLDGTGGAKELTEWTSCGNNKNMTKHGKLKCSMKNLVMFFFSPDFDFSLRRPHHVAKDIPKGHVDIFAALVLRVVHHCQCHTKRLWRGGTNWLSIGCEKQKLLDMFLDLGLCVSKNLLSKKIDNNPLTKIL